MTKKQNKIVCIDCIKELEKYLNYVKTKYKPRSHSYQTAVEDCIEVLEGDFSKIQKRDRAYELDYKQKLQKAKKKK